MSAYFGKNFLGLNYQYLLNFLSPLVAVNMIYQVFDKNSEMIPSWCGEFSSNSVSILCLVTNLFSGLSGNKFSGGFGGGL